MISPHVIGHGSGKQNSILPLISWIRPQIGLNDMNMIFLINFNLLMKSLAVQIGLNSKKCVY